MLTRHLNANSHKARLPITPRQERAKNCGIPRGAGNVVAKKNRKERKRTTLDSPVEKLAPKFIDENKVKWRAGERVSQTMSC